MEEKKNVIDKRSIKLEDVMKSDYIPFLGGRPDRQKVIGSDDVINLSIVLNTSDSVEELLKNISK
ncbi:MAG: hypothetical protein PHC61_02000 [Chitinivibrionales bacterium]|nr:hypothetical protein [Chitinivibrionales bacterium]